MSNPDCIFCKIVNGEIPSHKIYETDNLFAFMDINPLSDGHCLFIPKTHAVRMDQVDDNSLAELLLAIKKVVKALNISDYNILQNNGKIAHQAVMHAHFHLIPKPNPEQGLGIQWQPISVHNQEGMAKKVRSNL